MFAKIYLLFAFIWIGFAAHAQVSLITSSQLHNRLRNGSDTVFVVNFWATWCAPCVKELPSFERLPNKMGKRPVKVLLVSLDAKSKLKSAIVPFVKKYRLKNETFVASFNKQQQFIDQIDTKWSGSLPATLFSTNNGASVLFKEQEFDFETLKLIIVNLK